MSHTSIKVYVVLDRSVYQYMALVSSDSRMEEKWTWREFPFCLLGHFRGLNLSMLGPNIYNFFFDSLEKQWSQSTGQWFKSFLEELYCFSVETFPAKNFPPETFAGSRKFRKFFQEEHFPPEKVSGNSGFQQ